MRIVLLVLLLSSCGQPGPISSCIEAWSIREQVSKMPPPITERDALERTINEERAKICDRTNGKEW